MVKVAGPALAEALAGVDILIETLDGKTGTGLKAMPETTRTCCGPPEPTESDGASCSPSLTPTSPTTATTKSKPNAQPCMVRLGWKLPLFVPPNSTTSSPPSSPAAPTGLIPAFNSVSFQPIATSDVAEALLDAAVSAEPTESLTVGGPAILTMRQLAEQWKIVLRRRGLSMPLPLPGSFGTFLRTGRNLVPEHRTGRNLVPEHAYGRLTFRQWLQSR